MPIERDKKLDIVKKMHAENVRKLKESQIYNTTISAMQRDEKLAVEVLKVYNQQRIKFLKTPKKRLMHNTQVIKLSENDNSKMDFSQNLETVLTPNQHSRQCANESNISRS